VGRVTAMLPCSERSVTEALPPGTLEEMSDDQDQGLKERMTKQGEEAIGKLAQDLLDNPVVSGALSAAFETRERAMRAQELAMGALNIPSASDLERLTRRLRGVSQRLEGIEDGLDRVEQRIEGLGNSSAIEQRLAAIEQALERLEARQSGTPTAG
jgi:chromosome segregation ATPase